MRLKDIYQMGIPCSPASLNNSPIGPHLCLAWSASFCSKNLRGSPSLVGFLHQLHRCQILLAKSLTKRLFLLRSSSWSSIRSCLRRALKAILKDRSIRTFKSCPYTQQGLFSSRLLSGCSITSQNLTSGRCCSMQCGAGKAGLRVVHTDSASAVPSEPPQPALPAVSA